MVLEILQVFIVQNKTRLHGKYYIPGHVYTLIKSIETEGDMFVAPDESYMIVSNWDNPANSG
jgi:hypothetical protein